MDIQDFKFLMVGRLKSGHLRLLAKFRRNQSFRGRDMAIFRFSKMAAAAILDFYIFEIITAGTLKRQNCIIVPIFVEIGQTAAKIWRFLDLTSQVSTIQFLHRRRYLPTPKSPLPEMSIWLQEMEYPSTFP